MFLAPWTREVEKSTWRMCKQQNTDAIGPRRRAATLACTRRHLLHPVCLRGFFLRVIAWGLAGETRRSSKLYTQSYVDRTLKAKREGTPESRMQLGSLVHLKIPDSRINTIKDFVSFRNRRKDSRCLQGVAVYESPRMHDDVVHIIVCGTWCPKHKTVPVWNGKSLSFFRFFFLFFFF